MGHIHCWRVVRNWLDSIFYLNPEFQDRASLLLACVPKARSSGRTSFGFRPSHRLKPDYSQQISGSGNRCYQHLAVAISFPFSTNRAESANQAISPTQDLKVHFFFIRDTGQGGDTKLWEVLASAARRFEFPLAFNLGNRSP